MIDAKRDIVRAITPSELAHELVEIVAEICNVNVMWSQHPTPITINEMAKIASRIEKHLEQRCHDVSVAVERFDL